MKNQRVLLVQFYGLILFCFCRSMFAAENQGEELFENEIRPLLIEKCSECHTGAQKSGGLSVESREQLLKGGDSGPAINLAEPRQSLLLHAVQRTGELEMPPEEPLSQRELTAFKSWLMLKAPWPVTTGRILSPSARRVQNHWSFQPVTKPIPPQPSSNATIRNPIDQFVSRQLDQAGLVQAKEADKRTLIRRAFYTLTGLPPSPERVARFVANEDPEAYDKLIDELLDSPHYGEHWARHWLDVARYSDTKGYVYAREERFWVHAWTYRDWVVRSLNEDMPYDRFLKLQIAADQVDDKRESDLAAMGFLTLGRRFLGVPWEIIDDRIDTLCRATLGLTVGCARCHDHKYDPIPTADYYSLYGVFASSREQLVPIPHAETLPEFEQELTKRRTALNERLQSARRESSQRVRDRIQDYLQAQTELEKYPAQGFDQVFSKEDLLPAFVRRWQYYLHQAERQQDRIFVAWRLYRAIPDDEFSTRSPDVTARLQELGAEQINPLVRARFQTSPASFAEVIQRYASLFQEIHHRKDSPTAESGDNQ
ncbi:MAG: DUF1549 domain-containing protein, partial [Planctomycetaceae bacterium]|nr:DUF1549 domain-containing protein [Planctomycetaceae bacterium]